MTEDNKTNNRTPRSADTRADMNARKPWRPHLCWRHHHHPKDIPTGGLEQKLSVRKTKRM
jgi:hypothetical protein